MALAAAAELNRQFVGKVERGETSPTIDTIEKLSRALGVLPHELMIFEGDETGEHELVRRVQALVTRLDARDLERLGKIVNAFFE
jgi:transcriptional regulator with XRE-family HTH domain